MTLLIPIRQKLLRAATVVALMLATNSARSAELKLTRAEFDRLHKELTAAKEPWQNLPWQLSLLEARTIAVKENKPIYMLCRSGHPLACV